MFPIPKEEEKYGGDDGVWAHVSEFTAIILPFPNPLPARPASV